MATRRRSTNVEFSPGQAHYVLQRLISDRRISKGDVSRYVADMRREIDELEQRLQSLREASAASVGGAVRSPRPGRRRPGRPGRPPATVARRPRRRRGAVTAERRASQQLQGRYLGLIRQIPAGRRARYAKVAKDRGREAAIKEMASAVKA